VTPRRRRPCELPLKPHGLGHARLYVCGWRCDKHTPNALRGLPEAPPGSGWPPGNYLNQRALEDQEQAHDDRTIPPDAARHREP
jgi:hypothetical protein